MIDVIIVTIDYLQRESAEQGIILLPQVEVSGDGRELGILLKLSSQETNIICADWWCIKSHE